MRARLPRRGEGLIVMRKSVEFWAGYAAAQKGAPAPRANDRSDYARGYAAAEEDAFGPGGGVSSADYQND